MCGLCVIRDYVKPYTARSDSRDTRVVLVATGSVLHLHQVCIYPITRTQVTHSAGRRTGTTPDAHLALSRLGPRPPSASPLPCPWPLPTPASHASAPPLHTTVRPYRSINHTAYTHASHVTALTFGSSRQTVSIRYHTHAAPCPPQTQTLARLVPPSPPAFAPQRP